MRSSTRKEYSGIATDRSLFDSLRERIKTKWKRTSRKVRHGDSRCLSRARKAIHDRKTVRAQVSTELVSLAFLKLVEEEVGPGPLLFLKILDANGDKETSASRQNQCETCDSRG